MKNMTLETIAKACKGTLFAEESKKQIEIEGVVLDSRKVKKNFLFLATKGERVDGHSFIKQVYEAGAACVVCEMAPDTSDQPYILVEDCFAALRQIAEFYRMQLSLKVIGITGSVGKTSTKEFIASVLGQRYKVLKTEGNFNNEVGLPLTVLQIREEHEVAVLEMGINHFGEMDCLGRIAKPDICVMTNIGQCHLEFLGSREGILQAKSEMLVHMQPDGTLCCNGDDDMLATIVEVQGKKPVTFGLGTKNQVFAKEIVNQGLLGTTCTICYGNESFEATILLPGEHMVYNALAATAVAKELGLSDQEITQGIKTVPSVSGRSNIISLPDKLLIDDCYNANPVSMKAAIDLLTLSTERKVAILGDMGELGENEKELHTQVGAYAVEQEVDVLICIGTLSKQMAEGARQQTVRNGNSKTMIYEYATIQEAQSNFSSILQKKDTILVKASHSMGFQEIVTALSLLN